LFDDFVVTIDYEHRSVLISLPTSYRPPAAATPLAVRVDERGFPFLEATIALPGAEPVAGTFLIDGGANTYADLYKPFSDRRHIPPPNMKLLDQPGTSTGGRTESKTGRAVRVSVGPYSVANAPITFAQDVEGLMAATDYAGLIGAEFLERFVVAFDNPGKRIWLSPNGRYGEPAEYDQSGLRLRAEGVELRRFAVARIVPQSPASEAGIAPGDILESIDSTSTKDMTLTEIRSMLCRSRASYSIGLLRGNRHLTFALRLRPLI
jgi:hypothetical protein